MIESCKACSKNKPRSEEGSWSLPPDNNSAGSNRSPVSNLPFYWSPLGYASSHWDSWSASSQVSAKQTVCQHQNWPHSPACRCGIEGINQWRPGCEVHGLSHKGLLKKHSVWALSILTRECEQICHIYYPSLSRDEKQVYESICFLLFRFLCCNFDLFSYLHSHDTEAAAEEISLALRIQGG